MARPERIYLTGFMGCGKSTLGPRLAGALGFTFVDLDEAVVQRAGKSIRAIFAEDGEAAFRWLEADALRATAGLDRVVVATGGGTFMQEDHLRWARDHGTVVYLRVKPGELARRLRRGQARRPLLCDDRGKPLPPDALRQRIETLLAEREPVYRQAHLTVDVGRGTPEMATGALLKALVWHL